MRWFKKLGAMAAGVLALGADSSSAVGAKGPVNAYEGLRAMALNTSAAKLGLRLPDDTTTAYGVVMDMGVIGGTATLVAFSTGDASLYVSSGGGVIGSGQHDSVRRSALALVQSAEARLRLFSSTTRFDGPANGQVRFFILTNRGVLTAVESEDRIDSGGLPLSPVWYAGQKLLTDVRLVAEKP